MRTMKSHVSMAMTTMVTITRDMGMRMMAMPRRKKRRKKRKHTVSRTWI